MHEADSDILVRLKSLFFPESNAGKCWRGLGAFTLHSLSFTHPSRCAIKSRTVIMNEQSISCYFRVK